MWNNKVGGYLLNNTQKVHTHKQTHTHKRQYLHIKHVNILSRIFTFGWFANETL